MRHPFSFFFFNDTATTEIYTLSLHDALPISVAVPHAGDRPADRGLRRDVGDHETVRGAREAAVGQDRKSTRLNSSHSQISYAVFCLKKKKTRRTRPEPTRAEDCTRGRATLFG